MATEVKLAPAPEQKKRTLQEIQAQYQQLCFNAGQLQYQIKANQDNLDMMNKEIRDLNLEAAVLKADEAAEKAKEAAKAAAEESKNA